MKIPNKVIVCGKEIPVKFVDVIYYTKDGDMHITTGEYDSLCNQIELAKTLKIIRGKRLSVDTIETRVSVDTFYHELFHCICFNVLGDTDINSEANAQTFASIISDLTRKGYLFCDLLKNAFEIFKTIVTDISEQDYRRLEYAITNTLLKFED